MNIVELDDSLADKYEAFIKDEKKNLFFVSNKYRNLLKEFLGDEDHYFLGIEGGEIKAVIPTFLSRNGKYGPVLNSLSFYGSNGHVKQNEHNKELWKKLISHATNFAKSKNCASYTFIGSPFLKDKEVMKELIDYDYEDKRIGQVTHLPEIDENITEELMDMYHSKNRNAVRKAIKSDVVVKEKTDKESLQFLVDVHLDNMETIGGKAKPAEFFNLLPELFEPGKDYKIWNATINGKGAASLLLFYYNETVEYFTPVNIIDYRSEQPMSLIIREAMVDAVQNNFKWWNWGGTWKSQKGVHRFKKRWGTKDMPYQYLTKILNKKVLTSNSEELLREYDYYYVLPFNELK